MSQPLNPLTIIENDGMQVYEDDETFSFGGVEGHGIFKDFVKDIYLSHQDEERLSSPNDGLPWGEEEIEFLHEQLFSEPSTAYEIRFPFYLIANELGRSVRSVQDRAIEMLNKKSVSVRRSEQHMKAHLEAITEILSQPLEGSVACVSAYELVNHLMYSLVHYTQFDAHYDAKLLNEMIKSNYSINEMEEEMNHRTQGVFIDAYAMALRLGCLEPMGAFHFLSEVSFFVYFDTPINELKAYLERAHHPEKLCARAAILSGFLSTQIEVNGFSEQINNLALPLNIDDGYFSYEISPLQSAPRAWTSNDSITLKRGVLRGDALAKIARETGRSPLSLLLQLLQRPDMADQAPLDENQTSLNAIITRIAEASPDRSIKQMTTAKQRKALSSSVLIVVDEEEEG